MNPASVQHAALRMLLDEIDPLLKQTAAIAGTLETVRAELHRDLEALGPMVQRSLDAQPALLETGRRLGASAARIEAALQAAGSGAAVAPARPTVGHRWTALTLTTLLSAVVLAGGTWVGTHGLREQARIGRALQAAWPALDVATRARLTEVLVAK